MAISIFIIVVSTVLFLYWFRYTCVLLLNSRDAREHARRVAEANHLSFVAAQQALAYPQHSEALDNLHKSLDRDYRMVTYLLRNAGTQNRRSIEEHLLRLDYHLVRACYYLARPFSRQSARKALAERASIISHLADAMGKRVALS